MKTPLLLALSLALLFSLSPGCRGAAASTTAEESAALSLLAINVRKADALLLRSGSDAYLIDTGTEESLDRLLRALRNEGVSSLTGIIITHTDSDHMGGLEGLLDSDIAIGAVYTSGYCKKKKVSKNPVVKLMKARDQEAILLVSGDTLPLSGGTLQVLGPLERDGDKENNNSLVLWAQGGGGSMLLTGDMEFPEENSLLKAELIPRADVIKIANHGEDDATSAALIKTVQPSLAVISTNTADEPDTPSARVLALLGSWNIPVLVTQDADEGILITLQNGEITTEIK